MDDLLGRGQPERRRQEEDLPLAGLLSELLASVEEPPPSQRLGLPDGLSGAESVIQDPIGMSFFESEPVDEAAEVMAESPAESAELAVPAAAGADSWSESPDELLSHISALFAEHEQTDAAAVYEPSITPTSPFIEADGEPEPELAAQPSEDFEARAALVNLHESLLAEVPPAAQWIEEAAAPSQATREVVPEDCLAFEAAEGSPALPHIAGELVQATSPFEEPARPELPSEEPESEPVAEAQVQSDTDALPASLSEPDTLEPEAVIAPPPQPVVEPPAGRRRLPDDLIELIRSIASAAWTKSDDVAATPQSDRYVVFRLSPLYLAFPMKYVREVERVSRVTPVPGAPPSVCGLLNLRGEVIPLLDLRMLLDLGDSDDAAAGKMVVVDADRGANPYAVLVDELGGIAPINRAGIEPAPGDLPGSLARFVSGAASHRGRPVLLVDPKTLLPDGQFQASASG